MNQGGRVVQESDGGGKFRRGKSSEKEIQGEDRRPGPRVIEEGFRPRSPVTLVNSDEAGQLVSRDAIPPLREGLRRRV